MSVSVRSRVFPLLLTRTKFHVNIARSVSCKISLNSRNDGDKSLILGGPRELMNTEQSGVNVVNVKQLLKEKLLGEVADYDYVGGRFSTKVGRPFDIDDAKMSLNRDTILSLFDSIEKDTHLFHTMASRFNKKGDDDECRLKCQKDVGRMRYHPEVEDAINKQIMSELNAAFGYLSISSFFGRSDVGKHGTHKFFLTMCHEEIGHALKLIEYQLIRGGIVKLANVSINESVEWCSIAKALEISLEIEKVITDEICNIVCLAKKHDDLHTENLLVSEFVTEQYESINKLACLLSRAFRLGKCGIGDHIIDSELMKSTGHTSKPASANK